jgi:hypothetical protein
MDLRFAEKRNGLQDCRKCTFRLVAYLEPVIVPPEMKRRFTRARATAAREYLTHSEKDNKFDHEELYKVFELCVLQSVRQRMSQ